MHTTSEPSPKRGRAKVTVDSPKIAASVKKPRARKRQPVVTATALSAAPSVSEHEVGEMIATAAYFLAAERNFSPGHELDDWLEAERRIRALPLG